jgi:sterol desaturase/sphingolipid hydroxylase (fatty acid hydroxylase superfamily)
LDFAIFRKGFKGVFGIIDLFMLNYIALLIPLFLGLIALEWWYSIKQNDRRYHAPNTVLNMAVGAIDQFGALLYLLLLYMALVFSQKHFQWLILPNNWRQWLLAFLSVDFVSYWYHRFSHRINLLWAGHVTHHSSSYFNLSNGFRTSPFQGLFRIPFWMILPVFGFDPLVLVVTFKVIGLHDFFVHTSYIPKLGWLEWVIVTPSHHRVHHGKNEMYIDKNYGSALIIWDRMFGTYQEETEAVEYGITAKYEDDSPLHAIVFHFKQIIEQVRKTRGWLNKLKVLLMPPGWGVVYLDVAHVDINGEKSTEKGVVYYAIWLLITGVLGFVGILFSYAILPPFTVSYCFLLAVGNIVQSAILLNQSETANFGFWESFRLMGFGLFGYFLLETLIPLGYLVMGWIFISGIGFAVLKSRYFGKKSQNN